MSKKTRAEKEVSHLRREVEALKNQLRAQAANVQNPSIQAQGTMAAERPIYVQSPKKAAAVNPEEVLRTDFAYLKADLLRTGVLAVSSFAAIGLIYFVQTNPSLLNNLTPLLKKFGL
ncbi:MAG: hypothetical protein M1352_00505 [Patescibacteria group bacterium]|nr:hypothetical protein [Patescibacteria group bacterium]